MNCPTILFFLATLYLQQGEALKCYTCTSATDPKCSDPIDSSLAATECTPDIFKQGAGALKGLADSLGSALGKLGVDVNIPTPDADTAFTCVKAVKQDGEKRVVVRSCSIPKTESFDFCDTVKASGGIVTFCDSCSTDACNSAPAALNTSLLTLLCAAIVSLLLTRQ